MISLRSRTMRQRTDKARASRYQGLDFRSGLLFEIPGRIRCGRPPHRVPDLVALWRCRPRNHLTSQMFERVINKPDDNSLTVRKTCREDPRMTRLIIPFTGVWVPNPPNQSGLSLAVKRGKPHVSPILLQDICFVKRPCDFIVFYCIIYPKLPRLPTHDIPLYRC